MQRRKGEAGKHQPEICVSPASPSDPGTPPINVAEGPEIRRRSGKTAAIAGLWGGIGEGRRETRLPARRTSGLSQGHAFHAVRRKEVARAARRSSEELLA